jgi:hypothetical protein
MMGMRATRVLAVVAVVAVALLFAYVLWVGRQAPQGVAARPASVTDGAPAQVPPERVALIQRLTDQPLDSLPDETAHLEPAHQEEDYQRLTEELAMSAVMIFVDPLDPDVVAARTAALPKDFARVLGREVAQDMARVWADAMIEDMTRRRQIARQLLDLYLAGQLTPRELDARANRLRAGLVLAFRHITGVSADEHERLGRAEMAGDGGPAEAAGE